MIFIQNPLHKVIIDVEGDIDLSSLPTEAALLHLNQAYAFLPPPVVDIAVGIATTSAGEQALAHWGRQFPSDASTESLKSKDKGITGKTLKLCLRVDRSI